ncbi:hypothetical protein [Nostoc sp.]|uniref:hypothetical protein n=1 Tax=Nostoc sp. TaxID=1180 RepID=UPI002FF5A9B2
MAIPCNANASVDNANASVNNANASADNANASVDNANASVDNANASADNANAFPGIKNVTLLGKTVLNTYHRKQESEIEEDTF